MSANEPTVHSLIAELEKLLKATQRREYWSADDVAAEIGRTSQYVRETVVVLPSFPSAIRLPVEGRARALYKSSEVIAWLDKHKERKSA